MGRNPSDPGGGVLAQVREGLAVYDAGGARIGTVKGVQMAGGNDPAEVRRRRREAGARDTGVPDVGPLSLLGGMEGGATSGMVGAAGTGEPTSVAGGELPGELRQNLARKGFIRIASAGLFAADRFATPEQIARVTADGVILGVPGDALARG